MVEQGEKRSRDYSGLPDHITRLVDTSSFPKIKPVNTRGFISCGSHSVVDFPAECFHSFLGPCVRFVELSLDK